MTLAVWAYFLGRDWKPGKFVVSIVEKQFCSSSYYWMFPFEEYMVRRLHLGHIERRNDPTVLEVLKILEID